ncbi:hypothetical protein N7493_010742 [Penicillium malachiteum]|uniref:Uncharacterized protein n=1 Tax=Penicillium malachiteum TaxID=1324776 RepID=A0AAD6HDL1_9EURO|nr:hypothetical protein N7493_010742 [Penicillium malachiteum]
MSVFTFVLRALPFPFAWKRRSSTSSKGKEKESNLDPDSVWDLDLHYSEKPLATLPSEPKLPLTSLHRDVSHTLHIAVKQSPDQTHPHNPEPEPELGSSFEYPETNSGSVSPRSRVKCRAESRPSVLAREVSWASIVRSRCRWTLEQERELHMAERQLARCQKAWSSEQELWISYIQELSEEKEAHEGFMSMRMRQQEDERSQFRKAWKRRRSLEESLALKEKQLTLTVKSNNNGSALPIIRRFTLPSYLNHHDSMIEANPPALTCKV